MVFQCGRRFTAKFEFVRDQAAGAVIGRGHTRVAHGLEQTIVKSVVFQIRIYQFEKVDLAVFIKYPVHDHCALAGERVARKEGLVARLNRGIVL